MCQLKQVWLFFSHFKDLPGTAKKWLGQELMKG